MGTPLTHSTGGVVLNKRGEVLVVNQKGDSWSLPKGHIDEGETVEETARREIQEESGIRDLTLVKKLGSYQRYRIGKGGVGEDESSMKEITLFLFTTEEMELNPEDPENPEAQWVPIEEVAKLLTHEKDAAFFESVIEDVKKLRTDIIGA